MTTIVTRSGKGSALTHTELDDNFINLNDAKLETGNIIAGTGVNVAVSAGNVTISTNANSDVEFDTVTATEFIGAFNGVSQFDAIASVNLTAGDAVYIDGISGNTPTVALARSNSSTTMPAFGLAASTVTATNTVKIIISGEQLGLDAANFGETGITFALGDTVYISASEAGKLSNVKPSGEGNLIQNIGKIERATPTTNMTILVAGAGRTAATPALDQGNIFIGDSNNNSTTTPFAVSLDTAPSLGGNLDTASHVISSSTGSVDIRDSASIGPTNNQFTVGAQGQIATATNLGSWAGNIYNNATDGSGLKIQASQSGSAGTPFEVQDQAGDSQLSVSNQGVVTINNAWSLPNVDGTASQVLTTYGNGVSYWNTGGGGGVTNSFETVAANGVNIVATSSTDTLTLTPGTGISITGNAISDTVTISATGGGGGSTGNIVFTDYNQQPDLYSGDPGTTRPVPNQMQIGSGGWANGFTNSDTAWSSGPNLAQIAISTSTTIDQATNGGARYAGTAIQTIADFTSTASNSSRVYGLTNVLNTKGDSTATSAFRNIGFYNAIKAGDGATVDSDLGFMTGAATLTWIAGRTDGGTNTVTGATALIAGHTEDTPGALLSARWVGMGFDTRFGSDSLNALGSGGIMCIHNQDQNSVRFGTGASMDRDIDQYYFIRNEDLRSYSELGMIRRASELREAPTASAGALTLDYSQSNFKRVDVDQDITSISFTNANTSASPKTNRGAETMTVLFRADTTARTITFPSGAGYYYSNGINEIALPANGHQWAMVTTDGANFYISISPAFSTV